MVATSVLRAFACGNMAIMRAATMRLRWVYKLEGLQGQDEMLSSEKKVLTGVVSSIAGTIKQPSLR